MKSCYSSDFSKWWNKEYIWTIPGNGGSQGGGSEFPGVVLENKGWGQYNGWGQNKPSYDIYEEMLKDGAVNNSPSTIDHIAGIIRDESKRLTFQVEKVFTARHVFPPRILPYRHPIPLWAVGSVRFRTGISTAQSGSSHRLQRRPPSLPTEWDSRYKSTYDARLYA